MYIYSYGVSRAFLRWINLCCAAKIVILLLLLRLGQRMLKNQTTQTIKRLLHQYHTPKHIAIDVPRIVIRAVGFAGAHKVFAAIVAVVIAVGQ